MGNKSQMLGIKAVVIQRMDYRALTLKKETEMFWTAHFLCFPKCVNTHILLYIKRILSSAFNYAVDLNFLGPLLHRLLFPCKMLYYFHLVHWLKRCLMVAARGSVQGASGLPRLPVRFGGEPLEETCSAQPGQVCHMVVRLLVEFHLLIPEVDFEDVPETNVFCSRIQTHRSKRIWFGLFSRPPGFHPRILGVFCTWGKRARAPKVLHFRRYRVCSCFSSFILGEEEPHGPVGDGSPERGRCRRRADIGLPGG